MAYESRSPGLRNDAVLGELRRAARILGGDDVCEVGSPRTTLLWLYGSTMVEASVDPSGQVVLRAFLVHHPVASENLQTDLALFTAGLVEGELTLDEEGDVVMEHAFRPNGSRLSVARGVERFCLEADRMDDIVSRRLGGLRALDRLHATVMHALGPRLQADPRA